MPLNLNKPAKGTEDWNELLNQNFTNIETEFNALNTALTEGESPGEYYTVPKGGIIMWSGSISNIPAGWLLCNGNNGTPNMLDRFVVGAGSNYSVGDTGGSNEKNTSTDGSHSHQITVDGHALTVSEIPSHSHGYNQARLTDFVGSATTFQHYQDLNGYEYETHSRTTNSTGGGNEHNHSASSENAGNHSHTVDVRPLYYAVAFIMKA